VRRKLSLYKVQQQPDWNRCACLSDVQPKHYVNTCASQDPHIVRISTRYTRQYLQSLTIISSHSFCSAQGEQLRFCHLFAEPSQRKLQTKNNCVIQRRRSGGWNRLFVSLRSLRPPLWSMVRVPDYRSRGPGFYSQRYQIFWEVVGLERGPLSLVRTVEELLGRDSSGSGLENREYGHGDQLLWPCDTLYPQKLALTSPTWAVARSV
jgi:hypothetical protein